MLANDPNILQSLALSLTSNSAAVSDDRKLKPALYARIKRANPLPVTAAGIITPERLIDPSYNGQPSSSSASSSTASALHSGPASQR